MRTKNCGDIEKKEKENWNVQEKEINKMWKRAGKVGAEGGGERENDRESKKVNEQKREKAFFGDWTADAEFT